MNKADQLSSRQRASRFVIRPARFDEVAAMQDLERDAATPYGDLPETMFCLDLPARDEAEHERAHRHGLALVAATGDTLLGFALMVPLDGRAHLLEIAVARSHQGRGFGRRLIDDVERRSHEAGFREVTLTTFRDVPWNAPLYARLGYRRLEVGSDRPELSALRAEEFAAGFDQAPRVAMHKMLSPAT